MKKVSTKEFIWYAAAGLVVVFGIICMIFGIIGDTMGGSVKNNPFATFEKTLPLSLRTFGIIFMAAGVLVAVVALLVNAKRADREFEKKIRREQRLAAQSNASIEVKKAVEIVEEKPAE